MSGANGGYGTINARGVRKMNGRPTRGSERFRMALLPRVQEPEKREMVPAIPKGETPTRFVTKAEALEMIKPKNVPLLECGYELTVRPGVTLRRVKANGKVRYQVVGR